MPTMPNDLYVSWPFAQPSYRHWFIYEDFFCIVPWPYVQLCTWWRRVKSFPNRLETGLAEWIYGYDFIITVGLYRYFGRATRRRRKSIRRPTRSLPTSRPRGKASQEGSKVLIMITIYNREYTFTSVFVCQSVSLTPSAEPKVRIHRAWEGCAHPSPQR